jgi:hypothetical protein
MLRESFSVSHAAMVCVSGEKSPPLRGDFSAKSQCVSWHHHVVYRGCPPRVWVGDLADASRAHACRKELSGDDWSGANLARLNAREVAASGHSPRRSPAGCFGPYRSQLYRSQPATPSTSSSIVCEGRDLVRRLGTHSAPGLGMGRHGSTFAGGRHAFFDCRACASGEANRSSQTHAFFGVFERMLESSQRFRFDLPNAFAGQS